MIKFMGIPNYPEIDVNHRVINDFIEVEMTTKARACVNGTYYRFYVKRTYSIDKLKLENEADLIKEIIEQTNYFHKCVHEDIVMFEVPADIIPDRFNKPNPTVFVDEDQRSDREIIESENPYLKS